MAIGQIVSNSGYPSYTSVAQLKTVDLDSGAYVQTVSYYANSPTSKSSGGGFYNIMTSAEYTTLSGGAPDGYVNFALNNGNVAVLEILDQIDVKQAGAKGDNTTDDRLAIQAAQDVLPSTGGTLFFPSGTYKVSVEKGTNDKYGFKITKNNVTIQGERGASLRRLSSDISTYALSFPIILAGVPDDNATQISNVEITGLNFIGEDTRHSTGGSALMDGRQAIWIKNVDGIHIHNNKFTSIDSGAIWTQSPGSYDYENSAYYNTTKCYNIKINDNDFLVDSHATAGRALVHAINSRADDVQIKDNYFKNCDCAVNCSTTYDDYDDVETDTYTDSNLGASVKRVGRSLTVSGNTISNSSEHCLYLNGMGVACTGNNISVESRTVCNTNQIQVRGRGVTLSNNTLLGVTTALSIGTGAMDVTFRGNTIQAFGDSAGGIINVQSQGLTAYIDASSDFFGSYKAMENILIDSNVIGMDNASQTHGVAIRLYTDTSDANYTEGQMKNVVISNNTINRPKKAILFLTQLARNVEIIGNVFNGKDFVTSGFTTGTTMNSLAVLNIDDALVTETRNISFDSNTVRGFEYILYDDGGAGSAIRNPDGVRNNKLHYIKYYQTANFTSPETYTMFTGNQGRFFLDRTTWYTNATFQNSLYSGTGSSQLKSCILMASVSDMRIYTDDAGTYKAI